MATPPNLQSELALVGALPVELDGMWLLPTESDGGSLRLHALRVAAGRSLWYASIAELPSVSHGLHALSRPWVIGAEPWTRTLHQDADGLRVRAQRGPPTSLSWSLCETESERECDGGLLGVESEREIADLFVTESALLVLGVRHDDGMSRYQVGIAPRRERARVQWLSGEQTGWPELLDAREDAGLVRCELAVRTARDDVSARLVRWTIDLRTHLGAMEALLDFALDWPSVLSERRHARAALCGVCGESARPGASAALVELDLRSGAVALRSFGFARELGAPALARSALTSACAFVLLPVYDAVRDCTDCYVLDAAQLDAPPRAIIRLPPLRALRRTHWIESGHVRALDSALGRVVRALR